MPLAFGIVFAINTFTHLIELARRTHHREGDGFHDQILYCAVKQQLARQVIRQAPHRLFFTGIEIIETTAGSLSRRIQIAGIGLTREYEISQVASLRVSPMDAASTQTARWAGLPFGRSAGVVASDYGARTIKFGGPIDEAEAKLVVKALSPFVPVQRAAP